MVWKIEFRRIAALAASIVLGAVFLSGCLAETPRTELDWHVREIALHRHSAFQAAHHPYTHYQPQQAAIVDRPAPKPRPAWYTANNLPSTAAATIQPAVSYGGAPSFVWPVNGPVISDFGTTRSGQRNDGINISTPFGAPIRAAASGTISYAGNELRNYGNLILIKHDDGYVTAYAHAQRIVVNRGDTVAKGQIIAYSGSTGDVTSPQLHFEIRHGVQALNPHSLLATTNAS